MASIVANVYDENENNIDCKYQGFHYETGNWSTIIRDTENQQISFDTNDDDWDNEGVACPDGDTLLVVGLVDGDNRTDNHTRFGVTKIASTGDSRYIIDMQLKPCFEPSVDINITSANDFQRGYEITINVLVQSIYQWIFNDRTFYQRANWYGEDIFTFLNNYTIQYDFGDGYQDSNKHMYSEKGEYTINVKVISGCNKEIVTQETVKIKYKKPVPGCEWTPEAPQVNDSVTINSKIQDVDGTITNIEWFWEGEKVGDTTDLDYSFNETISEYKDTGYKIKSIIHYNDGYEDKVIESEYTIDMSNIPPEIDYDNDKSQLVVPKYIWNGSGSDPDGDDSKLTYNWKLYILKDGSWELVTTHSGETFEYVFQEEGHYKIELETTDEFGASTVKSEEFDINFSECMEGGGKVSSFSTIICAEILINSNSTEIILESKTSEIDTAEEINEIIIETDSSIETTERRDEINENSVCN